MGFDPVSLAAGAVGAAAETWYTNRQAESRQHQAQDFGAQQYANRYQTQVNDLMAAGLNPMLAYGSGPGSAPQSSAASAMPSGNITAAANATRIASAQEDNIQADTANKNSDTELKDSQKRLTESTAEKIDREIGRLDVEIQNEKWRYNNLVAQWSKDMADANLKAAMQASEQALQRLYLQQERYYRNQVLITNPKAEAAATTGAWAAHGENISKTLSPISDFISFTPFGNKRLPELPKYPKRAGDN